MGRDGYPWYRKGKKCWYFWQDGRQIRLAPDKEEALRLWHEIQADPEPRDEESGETVSVAVDRYLVEVAGLLKPETVLRKRRLLGRFKADMGGRLTTSVTVKEVQGWLAGHKGWNPSTRRLAGQMLSALFRWCGRPLEGLRLPPPRSRGAETLVDPDAQVAEILGHTGTRTLHFHYAHLVAKTHALRGALDRVRGDPGRA